MTYRIGTTVAVLGDMMHVSLDEHRVDEAGRESGVRPDMTVTLPGEHGPVPLVIGQPGSFVELALPQGSVLCMVTASRLAPGFNGQHAAAPLLEVLAVGAFNAQGQFERGSELLPTIGAEAWAVAPSTLERIYAAHAAATFSLGELASLPGQPAKMNLDAFLSRHAAILGQTGAGKSWTVASMLQRIARFPHASVILLDIHGEYSRVFGAAATCLNAAQLELPYWLMNVEELMDLCLERHETAAPLQIAKFKEVLQTARETNKENRALGIPKITMDTPVYFEFSRLVEELQQLDTEIILVNLVRTHGPLYGAFTRTIMKIQSRLNDRRYDVIFNPKTYNSSASMEALLRKLLGQEAKPSKLTVLDLSQVPFEVRPSLISLVLRCLFDFAYWYRRQHGVSFPLAVFCDEAHTYLNEDDPTHRPSRLSAERIAKEGRKYGMSLAVISQRPREVSSTILSQCNSFLCLRISNPDDQQYVRNLLPDSMKGIMAMLSTLRRGEALLVGDAVIMPTRIKVAPPSPPPDSSDVSFATEWSKAHAPVDVGAVLDLWRRQGL